MPEQANRRSKREMRVLRDAERKSTESTHYIYDPTSAAGRLADLFKQSSAPLPEEDYRKTARLESLVYAL